MGSRIHREVYVRFRGEAMETYLGNKARRCGLSLQPSKEYIDPFTGEPVMKGK